MDHLTKKIKVIHFHNGTGGGVLSVIRNLLIYKQHPEIENHVIYTINKERISNFELPKLAGAVTERVFYYSPHWNFYYTCQKLAKLLPDKESVIIAHDWLELGMVSNLGLQNPVVQFVHGDYEYYYNLAVKHHEWIDQYIAVSSSIARQLKNYLSFKGSLIHDLRFPVPKITVQHKNLDVLQIMFLGRCEESKGYFQLPGIHEELTKYNVKTEWHIAGEGSNELPQQECWSKEAKVHFYGKVSNEEVIKILSAMHILLLPSYAEGLPVSVIEAMKSGVVPVVNDLPSGLTEIIEQKKNRI